MFKVNPFLWLGDNIPNIILNCTLHILLSRGVSDLDVKKYSGILACFVLERIPLLHWSNEIANYHDIQFSVSKLSLIDALLDNESSLFLANGLITSGAKLLLSTMIFHDKEEILLMHLFFVILQSLNAKEERFSLKYLALTTLDAWLKKLEQLEIHFDVVSITNQLSECFFVSLITMPQKAVIIV